MMADLAALDGKLALVVVEEPGGVAGQHHGEHALLSMRYARRECLEPQLRRRAGLAAIGKDGVVLAVAMQVAQQQHGALPHHGLAVSGYEKKEEMKYKECTCMRDLRATIVGCRERDGAA